MVAASSAGHSGAASATWEHVHRHFAAAALFVAQNAADPSGGPKIDSHVDFDSTAAWRHHVSMPPSSRSQSAATTALAGGTCELFRVKRLREIPHWWILGRCLRPLRVRPHGCEVKPRYQRLVTSARPRSDPSTLLMTRLVYWLEPSRRAQRTTPGQLRVHTPYVPLSAVVAADWLQLGGGGMEA